MNTELKVLNFGNDSLVDANSFRNTATLLQKIDSQSIIVLASPIKGVVAQLEKIVDVHQKGDIEKAMEILNDVRKIHYDMAVELLGAGHSVHDELNDNLVTIEWDLEDPPHEDINFAYDQTVATASLLSTQLLAAYLKETNLNTQWLDARDVILTDDNFRKGNINETETKLRLQKVAQPLLEQGQLIVTQSALGTTSENYSITLNADESSAYAAATIADALGAKELYVWTKPLTADANLTENVIRFDHTL